MGTGQEKVGFLKRKNVIISFKRYGIDAMGSMALGLFASLLIGTIIKTIGQRIGDSTLDAAVATGMDFFAVKLVEIGNYATQATGAAMAVSIGYALQAPPLVLYSLAAVGLATNALGGPGGPLAVLFIAIIACEVGKLVSKETKVDILVTPGVTILVGIALAMPIAPLIGKLCSQLGSFISWATALQPFWMGLIISVVVGIVLTLPISSAAICAAIGISGGFVLAGLADGTTQMSAWYGLYLAGGAATAGCCAHMVGFATLSYPDNGIGGFVAQGLGTSMLQVPNLMKKPVLWLPPVIVSAITGPLATCLFVMGNNGPAVSSGMGTSGLVGPIGILTGWADMPEGYSIGAMQWIGVILICFVLPVVLTWILGKFFRAKGIIKPGDLKIDLG